MEAWKTKTVENFLAIKGLTRKKWGEGRWSVWTETKAGCSSGDSGLIATWQIGSGKGKRSISAPNQTTCGLVPLLERCRFAVVRTCGLGGVDVALRSTVAHHRPSEETTKASPGPLIKRTFQVVSPL